MKREKPMRVHIHIPGKMDHTETYRLFVIALEQLAAVLGSSDPAMLSETIHEFNGSDITVNITED